MYYGNPQRLEHDFIVAPGADPAAIQLAISGAEQATVNANGDLMLKVVGGEVVQQAPKIYQVIDGQQQAVAGRYVLREGVRKIARTPTQTVSIATAEPKSMPLIVGFEVAQYDKKLSLVIDPVIDYSSYIGSSGNDEGFSIAVDANRSAYITGGMRFADFSMTPGGFQPTYGGGEEDAFVLKLNASGSELVYSTYIGGVNDDRGLGITVDGYGRAYVAGFTSSPNFPTKNPLQPMLGYTPPGGGSDAFITILSPTGSSLVYY